MCTYKVEHLIEADYSFSLVISRRSVGGKTNFTKANKMQVQLGIVHLNMFATLKVCT